MPLKPQLVLSRPNKHHDYNIIATLGVSDIKLKGLGLLSGAIVSPTATVKLEINGVEKETSNTGVGPVDAALNAIRELIQDTMHIELEEYNLEAINGGTDALADVFVISSDNEGNKSTGRAIDDDIVMASILAVLDSINKLLLMKSKYPVFLYSHLLSN